MTPTELGKLFLDSRLIVHYRKSVDTDVMEPPHKLKNLLEQRIPSDVRLAVIDAPPMKDAVDAFVVFKTRELAEPYLKEKHASLLVSGIKWAWQCQHYAKGLKAAIDEAEARAVETTTTAKEIMADDLSSPNVIEESIRSQSGLEKGEESSDESESDDGVAVDSVSNPGVAPSLLPTLSDIMDDSDSEFVLYGVASVASAVGRAPRRHRAQGSHISAVTEAEVTTTSTTSVEPLAPEVEAYIRHEKVHPRTGLDEILLSVWKDAINHGKRPPHMSREEHLGNILREVRRNGTVAYFARGEMQAIAYKGFGYLIGH